MAELTELQDTTVESEELLHSWVLFKLDEREYGLRTAVINEMVNLPETNELPEQLEHIRGVINLRGQVMPVVDTRIRLGMEPIDKQVEELIELFDQREKDHLDWLTELETSVQEDREFTLTTDPHACAFGKWYDTFNTENILLKNQMTKFDTPHKAIHQVAKKVKELMRTGKKDEALRQIAETRHVEMAHLSNLFSDTKQILRDSVRQIVIISTVRDKRVGFIVDSVTEVRDIEPEKITEDASANLRIDTRFLRGIAEVDERLVILLDGSTLY